MNQRIEQQRERLRISFQAFPCKHCIQFIDTALPTADYRCPKCGHSFISRLLRVRQTKERNGTRR